MTLLNDTWNRLVKNSTRDVKTNCLLWQKSSNHGYGKTSYNGKSIYSHRLSYMIHKNQGRPLLLENENGVRIFVRHMCNNSMCIEPSHLKLGTQYENDYDDKILHGTIGRGEKHYNCSITEDIARSIKLSNRDINDPLYESVKKRSLKFSIPESVILCIDRGRSWAHIPDRNGMTTSHYKINSRKRRKLAKDRVWSIHEFETAKIKIRENSKDVYGKSNGDDVVGPCWEWLKCKYKNGYGRISIFGKCCCVHIISCESKYGRHRLENEVTRHMCANKICCNPDHLLFGNQSENSMDNIRHKKLRIKK